MQKNMQIPIGMYKRMLETTSIKFEQNGCKENTVGSHYRR